MQSMDRSVPAETADFIHVVGARPNFPKMAPVFYGLQRLGRTQLILHTGQHYDDRLSGSFIRELGLPTPHINLAIGSGGHAEQTGAVMLGIEKLLQESPPRCLVLYGDINSTAAGAISAAKEHVPTAHVEAGLRSFDRTMPEEVNRIVTDALADILFATSEDAVDHLVAEGRSTEDIHFVGNPMIDTLLAKLPDLDSDGVRDHVGATDDYAVFTAHRPANVDSTDAAKAIVEVAHSLADLLPVVMPLHPRGRQRLLELGLAEHPNIKVCDPLSYMQFVALVATARLVVTDSGGVQEETTILGVPCLTLRPNTERPVTITHGTNQLVTAAIVAGRAREILQGPDAERRRPPLWDGRAGERIADVLDRRFPRGH